MPTCAPIIAKTEPDIVFYIGGVDGQYSLSIKELKEIRTFSQCVAIWILGGDQGSWDKMREFIKEDVFTLLVNVDGHKECPLREQDLVLIGCVDPKPFKNLPGVEKDIPLGVCCALNPVRNEFLESIKEPVTHCERPEDWGHHGKYAEFLRRCKRFININWWYKETPPWNLNLKIFECAYSDTLFYEPKNSYLGQYFNPGWDYVEFDQTNFNEQHFAAPFSEIRNNLSKTIETKYSNKIFWNKVFNRLNDLKT